MSQALQNTTVSTRVSRTINTKARKYLESEGLTVSEYLRLALIKAANKQVRFLDFLDSPEALKAKSEAEHGIVHEIGDEDDFDEWVDRIAKDPDNA